ncbi:hypothetical protein RND81_09G053100 [Saponaria officinalis]|uniref:Secreted protein n=1 Tax=Saponaria officinalis TaxID=3572 RepID=A0AAW1IJ19_SAPOF
MIRILLERLWKLLVEIELLWLMMLCHLVAHWQRGVNLSSIRCPTIGNPRTGDGRENFAREAKEFLRQKLIGRQVNVCMEY